jgi:hypothetical protein
VHAVEFPRVAFPSSALSGPVFGRIDTIAWDKGSYLVDTCEPIDQLAKGGAMVGGTGGWTRPDKINLVIAIAAILAAVGALWPAGRDFLDKRQAPSASFIDPQDNARIPGGVTDASWTTKNAEHEPLWLVLRTSIDGHWYPSQRLVVQPDGKWWTKKDEPLLALTGS